MANPDHVSVVKQGTDATNKYVEEHPDEQLDLTGADLPGLALPSCNLVKANFAGANLAGANLSGANLQGGSLAAANLESGNLTGADCRGMGLHRARLQGADLRGVQMDKIGVGAQLMCASANTFQDAHWEKAQLEEILEIINLNKDWEIRYQIVPRS